MKEIKRLLASFLVVALVIALLPITAASNNISVTTEDNITTAAKTITATTGANGVSAASVSSMQISDMLAAAVKNTTGANTQIAVNIIVTTGSGAAGISVTIPEAAASALTNSDSQLTISSAVATVTLDRIALAEISKKTTGDITITATAADTSALSDESKLTVGTRPVYDLKIISAGMTISNLGGGTATVSVPYTPATGEDTAKIVVYYVSGGGALVMVPNCVYHAESGTVTFKTTHFSTYAVSYNNVSFSDVKVSAWYANYVTYLAAREIISDTGDGCFSPDEDITRAEFVDILARLSGDDLSGYTSSSFSDVTTTSWYFSAAQWANKSGIAVGSDGKFYPDANITREQMAAILYRYAEYVGNASNIEGMSVREFTDYESISSWALAPIQWAINNNIISGNTDGSFAPKANATRAQAAKVIAVFMQEMLK